MRKSASNPIGTLSVGNVINAAISVYKSNFRDFFSLALRSVGWLVLAIIGLIPVVMIATTLNNNGVTVLAGVAWLSGLIFCLSKSMTSRGVVSRMAYQQLINQPESLSSASNELANSNWKFLGLALWLGLFMTGVTILGYIALLVGVGIGVAVSMNIQNILGYLIAGIFFIAGTVAFIWILMHFYSSWFVAELPIAVEKCPGGLDAIGRSRQLSTSFSSRILMVILVAFLIVIPLNVVASIPAIAVIGQSPLSAIYIAILNGLTDWMV